MQTACVTIRGVQYDVEYTYEYDPSVGIDGVSEWGFTDLSAAEETALALTQAEKEAVEQELTDMARSDPGPDDF